MVCMKPIAYPIALLLAIACATTAHAQRFVPTPGPEILAGDTFGLALEGLPPGREVTLEARRTVGDGIGSTRLFLSQVRLATGGDGRIDLATQAPLPGGSYGGADVQGLLWSMTPAPGGTADPALAPGEVALEARDGETVLARATLKIRSHDPGVLSRPAGDAFPGAVFASLPGLTRRPALILLGGSEGGSRIARDAPVYASRGFAVLALPYYSPPAWGPTGPQAPELPKLPGNFVDIPVDRLELAREWLAAQPEVDARRIGVVGTSKGAEFALLAAVRMPWIRAVVALVPSDVVWEGWGMGVAAGTRSSFSWKGQPLPFVPYQGMQQEFAGLATGAEFKLRRPQDAGRAAHPQRVAAARIPVEDIAAPVFVAGADDDQVWDSGGMARNIAASRAGAGRETTSLVYPNAGHALGGSGMAPTTQYNAGPSKIGGTPEATARAQAEVWKRQFEFLRRVLAPVP
jgi:dienelactone hydrolase